MVLKASPNPSKREARKAFLTALAALFCAAPGCGAAESEAPPQSAFLGGETSVFDTTRAAFSHPATNLSEAERDRFFVGNAIFNRGWVSAVASVADFDGLGPLFNATNCSACHFKDGRGRPPLLDDERFLSMLVRLSIPGSASDGAPLPEPSYGGQLQGQAILGIKPEGRERITWEELPGAYGDGTPYTLRKPTLGIEDLAYGPLSEATLFSARVAPQLIGLGLLETIAQSDIEALEDPEDRDGDGISGRANHIWDSEAKQKGLGRFGWKANQPSLRSQTAGAFLGDMGITSSLFPDESCTSAQGECQSSDTGPSPQLSESLLADTVFYSSTLAVPAQRNWDNAEVLRGAQLFGEMGCAQCHKSSYKTGASELKALSAQVIYPYTDLLLHDMGEGLADGRPDFEASGSEWRTPPLWGLGLIHTVNKHQFLLHDGRARGFEEAILWHGGESEQSKEQFRNSKEDDRNALLQFLKSL